MIKNQYIWKLQYIIILVLFYYHRLVYFTMFASKVSYTNPFQGLTHFTKCSCKALWTQKKYTMIMISSIWTHNSSQKLFELTPIDHNDWKYKFLLIATMKVHNALENNHESTLFLFNTNMNTPILLRITMKVFNFLEHNHESTQFSYE